MNPQDIKVLRSLDPERWQSRGGDWPTIYFAVNHKYPNSDEAYKILKDLSELRCPDKFTEDGHHKMWIEASEANEKSKKDKSKPMARFATLQYWSKVDNYQPNDEENKYEDLITTEDKTIVPSRDDVISKIRSFGAIFLEDVDKDYKPLPFLSAFGGQDIIELGAGVQITGQADIGKSWFTLYCAKNSIDNGGNVILFDREDNPRRVGTRLETLGCSNFNENFIWQDDFDPSDDDQINNYLWFLKTAKVPEFSCVIYDSNMFWGGQEFNNPQVQSDWYKDFVQSFTKYGITTISIGHQSDGEGKEYLGSTALRTNPIQMFELKKKKNKPTINPKESGYVQIKQLKDKTGITNHSNGDVVAEFSCEPDKNLWMLYTVNEEEDEKDESNHCHGCDIIAKVIRETKTGAWKGSQKDLGDRVGFSTRSIRTHLNAECKDSHIRWFEHTKVGTIPLEKDDFEGSKQRWIEKYKGKI